MHIRHGNLQSAEKILLSACLAKNGRLHDNLHTW